MSNGGGFVSGAVDPETLYTKQACIGGGSFGKVYKGVDKRTGQSVAIKVIDVENAEDEVDDIIQEISILSGLSSPYVTKYYGSYLKGSDLWIIMEYCSGGSCGDLMKPGIIPEDYICIILKELLMGLEYLHNDKKLHRDIKAANILLGSNGQVKLADFGVSGQLSATMTKKNTFVGTPFWMAPEVIKQSGYDHKADIWSLGITALELALGEPPYADIHPMKVLFLIPKHPPPQLDGNFTSGFKDFVHQCLKKEPKERPSARELLRHPWIRRAKRTTYLTELIERHERWHARYGNRDPQEEDEPQENAEARSEDEDLWDFGTVRPVSKRGGGLKVMNDAATNARRQGGQDSVSSRKDFPYGEENAGRGTLRASTLNMPPPPLPKDHSFSNRPNLQASIPQSPGAAARIPLPPSPVRRPVPPPQTPPQTPRSHSATAGHSVASPSPMKTPQTINDDFMQRSIAADMSDYMQSLSINDRRDLTPKQPAQMPANTSTRDAAIPPFDGGRSPKEAKEPLFQQSNQQALPAFTPQPTPPPSSGLIPTSSSSRPQSSHGQSRPPSAQSSSSTSSSSHSPSILSTPQPPTEGPHHPEAEITALSGVVLPALDAAMQRRSHQLALLQRSAQSQPQSQSSQSQRVNPQDLMMKRQAHEQIRRLVGKVGKIMREIDHWDSVAPTGMGDGVEGFLEGVLEEVLCRVEAEDV